MGRRRLAVYGGVCSVALVVLVAGYLAGGAWRDWTRLVVLAPLAAALLDRWLGRRGRDRDG